MSTQKKTLFFLVIRLSLSVLSFVTVLFCLTDITSAETTQGLGAKIHFEIQFVQVTLLFPHGFFLVLISLFIINAVIIEISLYTYHGSTKRVKSWPTRSPTVETCQPYIRQPAGYISTLYSALTFLGA